MTLSDRMIPDTPQARAEALCAPRPIYVRFLLFDPSRARAMREETVVTVRAEWFDPEWQHPAIWTNAAIEDNHHLRARLREMADEYRGDDWHLRIETDGCDFYAGPASEALDQIHRAYTAHEREVMNP